MKLAFNNFRCNLVNLIEESAFKKEAFIKTFFINELRLYSFQQ